MIKFLKKYENKSFEDLVNGIIWQDLPFRLKAIFSKLRDLVSANEPSYKVYTALLTQSGTDAPVATVLENTLGGNVVWSRFNNGAYETDMIFNENTTIFTQTKDVGANIYPYIDDDDFGGTFKAQISTKVDSGGGVFIASDNILFKTMVEIRVYN